jgi:hypothetical protein
MSKKITMNRTLTAWKTLCETIELFSVVFRIERRRSRALYWHAEITKIYRQEANLANGYKHISR